MKLFLKRTFIFFIPFFLVSVFLEYKTRTVDSYYKQKIEGLTKHADEIEVLILGSSHAAEGIDPNQFDLPAYNMAFGSQTLYFDKRIVLKYQDQLPNLKYVVLCIDYQSLYYLHNPSRDIFYHYFYDIDYGDKHYLKEDISFFYFGYEPNDAIKQMLANIEKLENGWFSYDTTYYSTFREAAVMERIGHFNDIIDQNIHEKDVILADVDELLNELITHDITPVIITCPLHDSYRAHLNPDIVRQNEIDIEYLGDKHQINYWSFLTTHFDDTEYLDNSHLNKSGARRFGQIINDSLMFKIVKPTF